MKIVLKEVKTLEVSGLSLDEIQAKKIELAAAVEKLQSQLGDHNRCNADGSRMTLPQWNEWRRRTKAALGHRLHEMRLCKEAIRRINEKAWQEKEAKV
jgi:hypothetical protein